MLVPGDTRAWARRRTAMSRRKTERLLGLVVCLLSSERYLTATQIRDAVPGYPESFDAFKRMFERDKEELREIGVPLETGSNSAVEEEAGYRIPRQAYVLPEIRLEPDEAAVLALAARVWRQAGRGRAAAGGPVQRNAAGSRRRPRAGPWPHGYGGRRSWPAPLRAHCSSCEPRGSTRRRPCSRASSPGCGQANQRSARSGSPSGTGGREVRKRA